MAGRGNLRPSRAQHKKRRREMGGGRCEFQKQLTAAHSNGKHEVVLGNRRKRDNLGSEGECTTRRIWSCHWSSKHGGEKRRTPIKRTKLKHAGQLDLKWKGMPISTSKETKKKRSSTNPGDFRYRRSRKSKVAQRHLKKPWGKKKREKEQKRGAISKEKRWCGEGKELFHFSRF